MSHREPDVEHSTSQVLTLFWFGYFKSNLTCTNIMDDGTDLSRTADRLNTDHVVKAELFLVGSLGASHG